MDKASEAETRLRAIKVPQKLPVLTHPSEVTHYCFCQDLQQETMEQAGRIITIIIDDPFCQLMKEAISLNFLKQPI